MSTRSSAGLALCIVLLSGCQTWSSGTTLPSAKYLEHPAQYFPPTPEAESVVRSCRPTEELAVEEVAEATAPRKLVAKVYPVADLVVPIGLPAKNARTETTEKQLIGLLNRCIAPRTWSDYGGMGTLEYYPLSMTLVVAQTEAVQEQVAEMLAQLRKHQDVQISVELRFVTMSAAHFEMLGIDSPEGATQAVTLLDDKQVYSLLEAVQCDSSSCVCQAPRMTCIDGQEIGFNTPDLSASVRPLHLPSGHFDVGLKLVLNRLDADRPAKPSVRVVPAGDGKTIVLTRTPPPPPRVSTFATERTLKIPQGKTALLSGWTHVREVRTEKKPVSSLPYLGRLLRTMETTKQKEHLLVLVTPSLVEEKQEKECRPAVPAATVPSEFATTQPAIEAKADACPNPVPRYRLDDALPPSVNEIGSRLDGPASDLVLTPPLPPMAGPQSTGIADAPPVGPPSNERLLPVPGPRSAPVTYSNSRSLSLGYEIENVGRSRVANIDVHFTQDAGPWQRYPDSVLPIGTVPMTVNKDGRYGFVLVARSGAGLSRPAPKAGEHPQLWVVVDTVPPEVEFYPPSVHPNEDNHSIRLNWKASDANLEPYPVSLAWGPTPAGPWHSFATMLPGTGSYVWTPPEEASESVYLQLTAIDLAGNFSQRTTPEPVVVDQKVPSITGVRLRPRR